jgi:hypothetical protein
MANDLTTGSRALMTPSLPDSVRPLLESKQGAAKFSEGGEFLGCEEHWSLPDRISPDDLAQVRAALARYEIYLSPGRPDEIAGRLSALFSHYWVGQMNDSLSTLVASDWLEDLGEYPGHVVEEACRRWRRSENRKPKPAELRDKCQRIIARERQTRDRLRRIAERFAMGPRTNLAAIIDGSLRRGEDT